MPTDELEPWTFEVAYRKLLSIAPQCTLQEAEGHIQRLIEASTRPAFRGSDYCPCGACTQVAAHPAIVDFVIANVKIKAIKELRMATSLGLKESKDLVEVFTAHNDATLRARGYEPRPW